MNQQEHNRLDHILFQLEELSNEIVIQPDVDPRYSTDYVPTYPWGTRSLNVLGTCDEKLIFIANFIADVYNVAAIWGYRNQQEQTDIYNRKKGLPWPTSNHNVMPSRALDIVPYPTYYRDIPKLDMMLGAAEAGAKVGGFGIKLGKYFSNVRDYAHIEIV